MTVPCCPSCGRQFGMFRLLNKHIITIHPELNAISCPYCEGFHENRSQFGRCKSAYKKRKEKERAKETKG